MDQLFAFAVKHREKIITVFKVIYALFIITTIVGIRSLLVRDDWAPKFFTVAITIAEWTIPVYILTLIPGIARRFGIKHKLISILMIYRRYIGISVFLLIEMHFWFVRGVDWLLRGQFRWPLEVFELAGVVAGFILLLFGLTSNDISTKTMGVWWGRLHELTYTLVWIIFFHVALQTTSVWSILIGFAAVLTLSSHLFSRFKKR